MLNEKLIAVEKQNVDRFEEMSTRLNRMQEQVVTACKQVEQTVCSNVQSPLMNVAISTEQGSCSSQMGECGNNVVQHRQEFKSRVNDTSVPVSCNVTDNDHNVSHTHAFVSRGLEQCHSSVLNDLILPKFSHYHKQNIVQFRTELDAYFLLKGVPESLKLPLAMKAVIDGYSCQWLTAIYKDLSGYEHFKQAVIDLL